MSPPILEVVRGEFGELVDLEIEESAGARILRLDDRGVCFGRLVIGMNEGWTRPWVQVVAQSVGRHHSKICLENGRWLLIHSGTTNGTYLNGNVIRSPAELKDGDLIEVAAGATIRFRHQE